MPQSGQGGRNTKDTGMRQVPFAIRLTRRQDEFLRPSVLQSSRFMVLSQHHWSALSHKPHEEDSARDAKQRLRETRSWAPRLLNGFNFLLTQTVRSLMYLHDLVSIKGLSILIAYLSTNPACKKCCCTKTSTVIAVKTLKNLTLLERLQRVDVLLRAERKARFDAEYTAHRTLLFIVGKQDWLEDNPLPSSVDHIKPAYFSSADQGHKKGPEKVLSIENPIGEVDLAHESDSTSGPQVAERAACDKPVQGQRNSLRRAVDQSNKGLAVGQEYANDLDPAFSISIAPLGDSRCDADEHNAALNFRFKDEVVPLPTEDMIVKDESGARRRFLTFSQNDKWYDARIRSMRRRKERARKSHRHDGRYEQDIGYEPQPATPNYAFLARHEGSHEQDSCYELRSATPNCASPARHEDRHEQDSCYKHRSATAKYSSPASLEWANTVPSLFEMSFREQVEQLEPKEYELPSLSRDLSPPDATDEPEAPADLPLKSDFSQDPLPSRSVASFHDVLHALQRRYIFYNPETEVTASLSYKHEFHEAQELVDLYLEYIAEVVDGERTASTLEQQEARFGPSENLVKSKMQLLREARVKRLLRRHPDLHHLIVQFVSQVAEVGLSWQGIAFSYTRPGLGLGGLPWSQSRKFAPLVEVNKTWVGIPVDSTYRGGPCRFDVIWGGELHVRDLRGRKCIEAPELGDLVTASCIGLTSELPDDTVRYENGNQSDESWLGAQPEPDWEELWKMAEYGLNQQEERAKMPSPAPYPPTPYQQEPWHPEDVTSGLREVRARIAALRAEVQSDREATNGGGGVADDDDYPAARHRRQAPPPGFGEVPRGWTPAAMGQFTTRGEPIGETRDSMPAARVRPAFAAGASKQSRGDPGKQQKRAGPPKPPGLDHFPWERPQRRIKYVPPVTEWPKTPESAA